MQPQAPIPSSTGGTITHPAPGVIRHTAGNSYTGKQAAMDERKKS